MTEREEVTFTAQETARHQPIELLTLGDADKAGECVEGCPVTVDRRSSEQAGIMSELGQLHAKNVEGFHIVNAIAATISSGLVMPWVASR